MDRCTIESPIGRICVETDGTALTAVRFDAEAPARAPEGALLERAAAQLAAYFAGERRSFDLPLAPGGTAFQQRVWKALMEIPYGRTVTYGQLAAAIGSPRACRAVGQANNRNPIAIIVPCHRVIGASGALTGYAGGLEIKEYLLRLEGVL